MSRNIANLRKPWFGFKPFRFHELLRLLKPVLSDDKKTPFPWHLDESDDSEWNVLVSLQEAIVRRLHRIHDEREFKRLHPEGDWLLTTMEARDGEEVIVVKDLFKNIPKYT